MVKRVGAAHEEAAAHLGRGDVKSLGLLPLFGGFAAAVVAVTSRPMPWWAQVALWVSVGLALAAVLLLLSVVRPWLGGDDGYGLVWLSKFAGSPSAVMAAVEQQEQQPSPTAQAVDTVRLSARAVGKYRRVQRAVDCLICGTAALAVGLTGVALVGLRLVAVA